jgi:thiamine biosynthesis lipoprotein
MPVQNGLASVTVITQSSALADALSTACFVLGETKARELLKQFPEAEALFIYENGTLSATDGLPCVGEGDIPEYEFTSFS